MWMTCRCMYISCRLIPRGEIETYVTFHETDKLTDVCHDDMLGAAVESHETWIEGMTNMRIRQNMCAREACDMNMYSVGINTTRACMHSRNHASPHDKDACTRMEAASHGQHKSIHGHIDISARHTCTAASMTGQDMMYEMTLDMTYQQQRLARCAEISSDEQQQQQQQQHQAHCDIRECIQRSRYP